MNVQNSNTNLQNFIDIVLELEPNKILFAPSLDGVIEFEKWKDIPNYEGYYQVSNFGRVKSLKRMIKTKRNVYFQMQESVVKQGLSKANYRCCVLTKDTKRKFFQTQKLVAMAFLKHKPCGYKIVVDHKDNVSDNNKLWNLQLISQRENSSKDKKGGTSKYIGVSWNTDRKSWKSSIHYNHKDIHLGFFKDEKKASEYYQNALKAIRNNTDIIVKRTPTTSKHKHIYYSKSKDRWIADLPNKYVGRFKTEEEAYQALLIAQKE